MTGSSDGWWWGWQARGRTAAHRRCVAFPACALGSARGGPHSLRERNPSRAPVRIDGSCGFVPHRWRRVQSSSWGTSASRYRLWVCVCACCDGTRGARALLVRAPSSVTRPRCAGPRVQDPAHVSVAKDGTVEVQLDSNPTTGYTWRVAPLTTWEPTTHARTCHHAQEAGGAVTRHRSSRLALPSRAAGHSAEARADFFTSACVPLATRVQDIGIGEQRSGTDGLAVHFQKRRGDGGRGWYPDLHVQGCRPGREYARVCVQGATRPCVCVCVRARARMSKHC